ncbi:response regulator [Mucilaginibacter gynuensis]|uniref:Response regulator n=1 Tax=Mucilaginibacter gynuensis TaxID=1302236 RepID=A0ABP8GN22_9SPHI
MVTIVNKPASVFVIDDEPLDNIIFKMLIKRVDDDINVNAINDGRNAIDQLLEIGIKTPESLPDYIFLDLNMPGMNGWDFLKEFKRLGLNRFKKIQINILSSSVFSEDIVRSRSNPLVDNFFNKPINLDNLKTIFKPGDFIGGLSLL